MVSVFKRLATGKVIFVGKVYQAQMKQACSDSGIPEDVIPMPAHGFSWENWRPSRRGYVIYESLGGWVHDDSRRGTRDRQYPRSWKHQRGHYMWKRRARRLFKRSLQKVLLDGMSALSAEDIVLSSYAHLDACEDFAMTAA